MTTYTVFQTNDSDIFTSGLSLEDAAQALLTEDGHEYEIREKDGLFELFYSRHSRNSCLGAKLTSCAAGGFVHHDREKLLLKIVQTDDWAGAEAMTDEDFHKFRAEASE